MSTQFTRLNLDWNAEPNSPREKVSEGEDFVELSFVVNPWLYPDFREEQRAAIRFSKCTRWRLGRVNDEGWYNGQCRFSKVAPEWGEFYELSGDLKLEKCPNDWNLMSKSQASRHFLFYLRDSEFECSAEDYEFISDANI